MEAEPSEDRCPTCKVLYTHQFRDGSVSPIRRTHGFRNQTTAAKEPLFLKTHLGRLCRPPPRSSPHWENISLTDSEARGTMWAPGITRTKGAAGQDRSPRARAENKREWSHEATSNGSHPPGQPHHLGGTVPWRLGPGEVAPIQVRTGRSRERGGWDGEGGKEGEGEEVGRKEPTRTTATWGKVQL